MMTREQLRIVFMGTPEFAVATLQRLVEGGYNVVAVVTQPDKPVGRHGSVLQAPEVKKYALEKGIPVLQPEKMKDPEFVEQLRQFNADVQVVVAFRMLPEVVWNMPRMGTFNVTTFFLDHDIDTGKVILRRPFDIPDDADVEYVYDGLMALGAQAAIDTIDMLLENDGKVEALPQDTLVEGNTPLRNAPKIFKETCQIDWTRPAKRIYDFVRGLSPVPGAWTTMRPVEGGEEKVVKIYRTTKMDGMTTTGEPGTILTEKNMLLVATGDGMLRVDVLQMAGKKRMEARDFLNGFKNAADFILV